MAAGGLGSFAFERLESAGLAPIPKPAGVTRQETDSEVEILDTEEFHQAVEKIKKLGFKAPPTGNKNPPKTITASVSFKRDPKIVAFTELRANGICDGCDREAPFVKINGGKYLEVHHIQPLSEGGPDTIENAAALCPNCHRECHHGAQRQTLQSYLTEKVAILIVKIPIGRI